MRKAKLAVHELRTLFLRDFLEIAEGSVLFASALNMGREKRVGLYRLHICNLVLPTK